MAGGIDEVEVAEKTRQTNGQTWGWTDERTDYQPMAGGIDEVEAAVNSVVDDVSSVQPTLILKVPLKLVIDVANHRLEAEKDKQQH